VRPPSTPDTRRHSKSSSPAAESKTATSPYQASVLSNDPTKLQPLNQEWVGQFRQRQRDKYKSPTKHTSRRSYPVTI
jgi:hypothetical protein